MTNSERPICAGPGGNRRNPGTAPSDGPGTPPKSATLTHDDHPATRHSDIVRVPPPTGSPTHHPHDNRQCLVPERAGPPSDAKPHFSNGGGFDLSWSVSAFTVNYPPAVTRVPESA